MEFYGGHPGGGSNPGNKFQFPTGWNSTQKQKLNEGVPFSSFNSQRDGILRYTSLRARI